MCVISFIPVSLSAGDGNELRAGIPRLVISGSPVPCAVPLVKGVPNMTKMIGDQALFHLVKGLCSAILLE